jgi:type III secretory pathway component EscR
LVLHDRLGGVFNHLIFFVLVDGWSLVAGSLIQSYGT